MIPSMPVHVVAAAIVREGRVLAARRRRPLVGWEFPGGKLEPGESEPEALRREIAEELGVPISVGARLGDATDTRIHLVLYRAGLRGGEPRARADHDALRWLAAAELDDLDWLSIDRQLLDRVRDVLS
jgi:8-oxo-dGTP diphosphatase